MLISNINCEQLILTLETKITQIEVPILKAELIYTYQCGEKQTKDIRQSLPTQIATANQPPIQVSFNDFKGMEDKLCDGIYELDIRITYQNGSVINEQKCYFNDCHTSCDVLDKFNQTQDPQPLAVYQALLTSQNCTSCNCKERCELFNFLTKSLKNESKCGCS